MWLTGVVLTLASPSKACQDPGDSGDCCHCRQGFSTLQKKNGSVLASLPKRTYGVQINRNWLGSISLGLPKRTDLCIGMMPLQNALGVVRST